MSKKDKSRTAVVVSLLYLLVVVVSFVLMLITQNNTPMSGIFLVLITPPWALVLGAVNQLFQTDSSLAAGLILLAGGTVNSVILYQIISFTAARFSRDK
jgi:membrane-associated HD superfamily phosphohydrolase